MNDTIKGRISVIMGIYNCAATLPDAIESILQQTYSNWELIMCDDASTDNTYEIAQEYQKKYSKQIILLRNEANSKLAFTLNHCLQYASGEFIARMDGDDKSFPERFEKQLEYLVMHPNVDLVGTSMQRFNSEGLADIDYAPEKPDRYYLRKGIPFNHATILCYKKVFDKLNGYTVAERTKRAQDYDLWFRFYYEGFTGENMIEPLYYVREDVDAIKRRTFSVRWNAYKTTRYGFKLLDYPKIWLVRATITMLVKSIVPFKAIAMYRNYQKKKSSLSTKH